LGEFGELGPSDMQLAKRDETEETASKLIAVLTEETPSSLVREASVG
jgi:hypothetical protein